MQSGDRLSEQGQYFNDTESTNCAKDVKKEKSSDNGSLNLHKAFDVKKFWKEEPFPDFIPKTKEELLAYDINLDLSDKHELHKKMGPWISLKVMGARENEAATTVDEINWDFYWKCGIHENTVEFLLKVIPEFINEKKDHLCVYKLTTSSIVNRVSASRLVELLQPILGYGSQVFVYRLWSSIILWHNLELGNAFP